jgi:hypothetical protein
MPCQAEKPGGLPCCQTPAPNLLGRCRPPDKQISSTQYSLGQNRQTNLIINKQLKKKRQVAKRAGCLELWRVEEGNSLMEL